MQEFNLVKDGFIDVRIKGSYKAVNLRELFLKAHQIDDIRFDDTMANCAIHRFIVAMTYHMLEIQTDSEWHKIFKRGKFDSKVVNAYFDKYYDRFELFGERPFYQDPDMKKQKDKEDKSINVLRLLSSNEGSLFSKDFENVTTMNSKDIAMGILVCCLIDNSGGKGHSMKRSQFSQSSRGAIMDVISGDNLFKTILFNTPPYDALNDSSNMGCSFRSDFKKDRPWWATSWKEEKKRGTDCEILGYMDYLTRPCRRLKIVNADKIKSIRIDGGYIPEEEIFDPFCLYAIVLGEGKAIHVSHPDQIWQHFSAFVLADRAEGSSVRLMNWQIFTNIDQDNEQVVFHRLFICNTDKKKSKYQQFFERQLYTSSADDICDLSINLASSMYDIYVKYRKQIYSVLCSCLGKGKSNKVKIGKIIDSLATEFYSVGYNLFSQYNNENLTDEIKKIAEAEFARAAYVTKKIFLSTNRDFMIEAHKKGII